MHAISTQNMDGMAEFSGEDINPVKLEVMSIFCRQAGIYT